MKNSSLVTGLGIAVVLCLLCTIATAVVLSAGYLWLQDRPQGEQAQAQPQATPELLRPTLAPTKTGLPTPSTTPTSTPQQVEPHPPAAAPLPLATLPEPTPEPPDPAETLRTLHDTLIPVADLADIARRLKGISGIAPTLPPPAEPARKGDKQQFWLSNEDEKRFFQVDATLQYFTDVAYFYVEDGVRFEQRDLERLVNTFNNRIYPTNRAFFGTEWSPGVDGDPRVYILYARGVGNTIVGYFSSSDQYPPAIQRYSNAHEMFIINADNVKLDQEYIYSTLAHEFQHMIHWNLDLNEEIWMNEGFADLASFINGYTTGGHDWLYVQDTDLQLNDWPVDGENTPPHYGAAFLYTAYFLDRFGETATQALVGNSTNGLDSVDQTLGDLGVTDALTGQPITNDDLFIDWAVTNYLHDSRVGDGRFAYHNYEDAPQAELTQRVRKCDTNPLRRDVRQYGVDYYQIECRGDFTLRFEGSTLARLTPADPLSGKYAFWANKGSSSDVTLTRSFDLTDQAGPLTLTYWTWYDIEEDFDYLYVLASEDGENWAMLHTPSGTDHNPMSSNLGWGYTGLSGDGGQAHWIQEKVDLSGYAGKHIQLRFEYITDLAVTAEGFLLDNVSIPEIGYFTDFESDDGGWQAAGFARIQNALPQSYRLALIHTGSQPMVEYLPLAPDNTTEIKLSIGRDPVILVVSGTARFTRLPAAYELSFSP